MSQRILNDLNIDTSFAHSRSECMPKRVATKVGQEYWILLTLQKHLIIAISYDASNCLVQCHLMLRCPETIDKDEISISINRYFTPNIILLLKVSFLDECLSDKAEHRNLSIACFCLGSINVEVAALDTLWIAMIIVNQCMIDIYQSFFKINVTPAKPSDFSYTETGSNHHRNYRIPMRILRTVAKEV